MPQTRKDTYVPLIGNVTAEICGNRLPSNRQLLQCYFYYTRHAVPKKTAREAAMCVVRKCTVFWEYAQIPIIKECNAINKLEKLVQRYKKVTKYGPSRKENASVQSMEIEFEHTLNELFDIAHQKEVTSMRNEAARTLLNLHREQGRKVSLDKIIDTKICGFPDTQEYTNNSTEDKVVQVGPNKITANLSNYLFDEDEDIDEVLKQLEERADSDYDCENQLPPVKCKKMKITTPDITAILDRAKVSDRMAARILAGVLMTAEMTLEDVHLSRETLRRNRISQRKSLSNTIRDNFKKTTHSVLTVHWDAKQFSASENKFDKIERLPILVSSREGTQLLGVPTLKRGTGEEQANAIHSCLVEWEVVDDICAMVFDTTASNTSGKSGACVLLEHLLGKNLLYLACHHHIFELLLKSAFECTFGPTSGPDVPIFKRFQGKWSDMNKGDFLSGMQDIKVKEALKGSEKEVLAFTEAQLKNPHNCTDYKESLELVMLFFGKDIPNGNRFRALGPIHHARWMAKAIYTLKIFLLRNQFHLTPQETSNLRDVCVFIVIMYLKSWFTAPDAVTAPKNDLELLKKLTGNTSPISSKICVSVFDKFVKHLWYLSEDLIAFAFFDPSVSVECKRKMCEAIRSRPALKNDRKKRETGIRDTKSIENFSLDSFVTFNTIKFFEILKVDYGFLSSDPTTWEEREDFIVASKIVKSLYVTNDLAERSVSLITEYNDLLSKDEAGKQDIMLIVQKFREASSDNSKESLKFSLENYLNNLPAKSSNDE